MSQICILHGSSDELQKSSNMSITPVYGVYSYPRPELAVCILTFLYNVIVFWLMIFQRIVLAYLSESFSEDEKYSVTWVQMTKYGIFKTF